MFGVLRRNPLVPAAWLGILTLAACSGRDRPEAAGEAPAATADTAMSPAPTGTETGQAAPRLTDANIVALLDEANAADSTAGALARDKATSPEVKDFAKLMMSDHHALRLQGQQLAKRLKVTPELPANDPVKSLAEQEMAALQSAAKGPEFDRTYIEHEVAVHKAVLDLAEQSHEAAQNEQLKALIEKAKPVIQKHLDQAEKLQEKLGKPTA